jgi:acyl-CoA reductase-like NAD-dependent aldehyde dehydrogenase
VAEDLRVDAVTLSGGAAAEYALHEICVRRHIPFQAELGGNNAAIVWEDAAVQDAADQIAQGAFGFAGQRCTANRRVIVAESIRPQFMSAVHAATARLVWGDPRREETTVGPLIGMAKRREFAQLLARARAEGSEVLIPHAAQPDADELMDRGAYHPPAIVEAAGADHEIVQEESFAPVLVVQTARTFGEALALCNGVRQGLVAAVFTRSAELREEFLREARAGVLKINQATADADAVSPLGGWKASGVGPAEHGPSDREFYTRVQTIYG